MAKVETFSVEPWAEAASGPPRRNQLETVTGGVLFDGPAIPLQSPGGQVREPAPVGPRFSAVLGELAQSGERIFGTADVVFEPVRRMIRPSSEVLEIQVRHQHRATRAFLKIYKPSDFGGATPERLRRRLLSDFQTTARLLKALPGGAVRVVRPIACFPQHLALVTAAAQGRGLAQVVRRGLSWRRASSGVDLPVIFFGIGRWLAQLQATAPAQGPIPVAELRDYLELRLLRLIELGALGRAAANRLRRRFDGLAAAVDDEERARVPVHGDLCFENVVVHGSEVTILDFADAGSGTRFQDAAYLFLQLEILRRKPWISSGDVRRMQAALLAGLGGVDPRHPLFQLMLLQHRACRSVDLAQSEGPRLEQLYARWLWTAQRRAFEWG